MTTTTPALASLTAGQGSLARWTQELTAYADHVDAITARILAARERLTSETGEAAMTATIEAPDQVMVPENLYRAVFGDARANAAQLGFGWTCTRSGEGTAVCEAGGSDRAEFTAHMKAHGARPLTRPYAPVKLRKTVPAASLPKLSIPAAKWIRWTEHHAEPGTCSCGHSGSEHNSAWAHTKQQGCTECSCTADYVQPVRSEAKRRGQFLALGTRPHRVWVIPFEPAPWESGHAAPVELEVSSKYSDTPTVTRIATDPGRAVRLAERVRRQGIYAVEAGWHGTMRRFLWHTDTDCQDAAGLKREPDAYPQVTVRDVIGVLIGEQGATADVCERCVWQREPEPA